MMVTFVSQCEKKALMQTRRVLDAFANRIGDSAWQTVITQEGLNAVKKLLSKTASKNTAVSCHWIRSRSRTELLWVVGKKDKFNRGGIVPVNTTTKNITNSQWENNWHYMPLIRVVTALAALLHDWGKATVCFQNKLKENSNEVAPDPLRHEWISCLLFHAFVCSQKNKSNELLENDSEWLGRLKEGEIDENYLKEVLKNKTITKPLNDLPPLATMILWLILTHHRLPLPKKKEDQNKWSKEPLPDYKSILEDLDSSYGYLNRESAVNEMDCLTFKEGLLSNSFDWLKEVKKWANKASKQLSCLKSIKDDKDIWRTILFHSRLSLMLGDHNYSSQKACKKWNSSVKLFANTKKEERSKKKELDQKLDEHLVKVSQEALNVIRYLPRFANAFPSVEETKILKGRSAKGFEWQDKATEQIKQWREHNKHTDDEELFGFFAVNMASTGKGKTFANAKIMRALSKDGHSLRYVLALGLRTLTLQTGAEYKERLKINNDLAILVGSKAVVELYDKTTQQENRLEDLYVQEGSESREELLEEELDTHGAWDCDIPMDSMKTVFRREKDRNLLYAPVLVCTIDHIMGATETIRGGRYILPSLRLMSSDLVIDEVDDFDINDLKAIGRLIHLAGMLGRKVMISSATIPPDLAKGFFHAYSQGWQVFAKSRGIPVAIGSAWIDEFKTEVKTIVESTDKKRFPCLHDQFVEYRIKKLQKEEPKRKAEIVALNPSNNSEYEIIDKTYFESIKETITKMHKAHFTTDETSKKQVSFGIVRMANINPCVKLTKYLLKHEWPNDINIRTMAYHSQQVLLMRSEQERHLDEVLKRKNPQEVFQNTTIKKQLSTVTSKNVIYILVATPIEEIGRDHDFDWAVVEPSSYRSIIQLAGRVLRHRSDCPTIPNVALMQYNLKGYRQNCSHSDDQRKPVFCRPGYENLDTLFLSHNLKDLVDGSSLQKSVNAIPRVKSNSQLNPTKNLVDLEHQVVKQALNMPTAQGAGDLEGWLSQYWWLTGIPQGLYRFRKGVPSENIYLIPDEGGYKFQEKDSQGKFRTSEVKKGIKHEDWEDWEACKNRLWLNRDYDHLLNEIAEEKEMKKKEAAKIYGELSLTQYRDDNKYIYSPQFGLIRR